MNAAIRILKLFFAWFLTFMAISGLPIIFFDMSSEPTSVLVFVDVLMAVIAIVLFCSSRRDKKRDEMNRSMYNPYAGSKNYCVMRHIDGLPMAKNMDCTIILKDDRFVFTSGKMQFELEKSRIQDIYIRTETAPQGQQSASVNGIDPFELSQTAAGNTGKNYLIIQYLSVTAKRLCFEIGTGMLSAYTFIDDVKRTLPSANHRA